MFVRQIHDEVLGQYAYILGCHQTGEALVVDPERDVDRYAEVAAAADLRIVAVAETHIHADFLSGARELGERHGARIYLSAEGGEDWQYEWALGGSYPVRLLRDGDSFSVGKLELTAIHTPGHTPEHLAYLATDHGGGAAEPIALLSGDFVFVGDVGRPDLLETAARIRGAMEPLARRLHGSLQRFLELPDYVQVWPGHGAGSACGKSLGDVPQTTVGYERRFNPAIDATRLGDDAFVDFVLRGQPEPPLYFARMKQRNRSGVPLLGSLPVPRRVTVEELVELSRDSGPTVLDTRSSASSFMERHLPGSLYVPLDRRFSTAVGSLLGESTPIYLVAEEDHIERAIRSLVRIGFDRIEGFSKPGELEAYFDRGGERARIEQISFNQLTEESESGRGRALDVRFSSEYEAGHVPGALHISYTRLAERLEEINGEGPLFVYCNSGARAAVASAFLAREGMAVKYVGDPWASYEGDGAESCAKPAAAKVAGA